MDLLKFLLRINRILGQLVKIAERETAKRYARMLAEVRAEMASQYEKYEKDGKLSLEEMVKHDRLRKLEARFTRILSTHYADMYKHISRALGEMYKDGYYLTAHSLEQVSKVKIGYSTVTPETLQAMLDNPVNGLTLKRRLERNRNQIIGTIQQEVTAGLQNNESYSTMSKRLKSSLEGDAVKSMRIVRTEGHRVQESAKNDAATHATKNGVIMVKEWNSLEDERVRRRPKHAADHKKLNGTKIAMDKLFDDGLSKGPAPGQMGAAGSDINCRCFLTYSIERLERPQHEELAEMELDTWKKERLRKR